MYYTIKAENLTTRVGDTRFETLRLARTEAKSAASSALCEPARVAIYRDDEPVEIWEDGKRVWRNRET